ncbi:MAG: hypothetical protein HY343_05505, partial [Lentisphaerae bacterium]|nr:hypothetical protein [Lentisphaerota bacterium]
MFRVAVLAVVCAASPALAALTVTNDLDADTTWAVGDSPVSITKSDFYVQTNAVLTIDPGVVVKVAGELNVRGSIRALGTAGNRITFTELSTNQGWDILRFTVAPTLSGNFRTNIFEYVNITNLTSYIYVSEAGLSFDNCYLSVSNSGNYAMAAWYGWTNVNPARITFTNCTFDIFSTYQSIGGTLMAISLDGFPSEFVNNTIRIVYSGGAPTVYGIRCQTSNTDAFRCDMRGNTITMRVPENVNIITVYGLYWENGNVGDVVSNAISLSMSKGGYGIFKSDTNRVEGNIVNVSCTGMTSFAYAYGLYLQTGNSSHPDFCFNNRVTVNAVGPDRYLYGMCLYGGLVRGNRIKMSHDGPSGAMFGIAQEAYGCEIAQNTIEMVSSFSNRYAVGMDADEKAVVHGNLVLGPFSTNEYSMGIHTPDSGTLTNSHNLVWGFPTAFSNCTAGAGTVEAAPQFADTNLHLLVASPAVEAGTNQPWMTNAVDIDGVGRIQNGRVDIGAYEYNPNQVSVTMTSAVTDPSRLATWPVVVQFSEDVEGFTNTDITVVGGNVSNFATASASNYTFNLIPLGAGRVTADIAQNCSTGASGPNAASVQFARTYDPTQPSVTLSTTASDPTGTAPIPVTVVFSESVADFAATDVIVANATIGGFMTNSA